MEIVTKSQDSNLCEHIAKVILLWVNNHYNEFESNHKLYDFLEKLDDSLQNRETEVNREIRNQLKIMLYLI